MTSVINSFDPLTRVAATENVAAVVWVEIYFKC